MIFAYQSKYFLEWRTFFDGQSTDPAFAAAATTGAYSTRIIKDPDHIAPLLPLVNGDL